MHCQQTVVQSAFARRLDNCIGRLPQLKLTANEFKFNPFYDVLCAGTVAGS